MPTLRLLADDLTGALDTAAEFVPLTGPVGVFWRDAMPAVLPASAAMDSGTRELPPARAAAIVAGLVPHMTAGTIAYKKIDSLLRGPTLTELAACLRAGPWRCCVLAPAFPFQGRVTRGGVQFARDAGGAWVPAGDMLAGLQALGVEVRAGSLDQPLAAGFSVFDAETDDELGRVAAYARDCGEPVLLAGTGGLAQAICRQHAAGRSEPFVLPTPVLGLFGSDQPATFTQLRACGAHHLVVTEADTAPVADRLAANGIALASLALPPGIARADAAARIAAAFGAMSRALPRPGTLAVAGGETLRAICAAVGAGHLDLLGRVVPGVPVSILRGGRWDGVTVLSKSGAFGHPSLLRDILLPHERSHR